MGLSRELKASGHERLWERTREAMENGELVMTNFVDFDMLFGHRRDPKGYDPTISAPRSVDQHRNSLPGMIRSLPGGIVSMIGCDHQQVSLFQLGQKSP